MSSHFTGFPPRGTVQGGWFAYELFRDPVPDRSLVASDNAERRERIPESFSWAPKLGSNVDCTRSVPISITSKAELNRTSHKVRRRATQVYEHGAQFMDRLKTVELPRGHYRAAHGPLVFPSSV
jgi:hypothetical protein